MSETIELYRLKGNRVVPLDLMEIRERAENFCDYFRITTKTKSRMSEFLEILSEDKICIDPIDDSEWLFVTDGICVPSDFTIRIPDSTYLKICNGDAEAIGLILHELGHLVLAHKQVLHKEGSAPATREEDAEWQADRFSEFIRQRMRVPTMIQMELDFNELQLCLSM